VGGNQYPISVRRWLYSYGTVSAQAVMQSVWHAVNVLQPCCSVFPSPPSYRSNTSNDVTHTMLLSHSPNVRCLCMLYTLCTTPTNYNQLSQIKVVFQALHCLLGFHDICSPSVDDIS